MITVQCKDKAVNIDHLLCQYFSRKCCMLIVSAAYVFYLCRGVEIVKFSTCPGASKKPKCTCP